MKYVHTNIAARNWRDLADFYIKVFGCTPVQPERHLSGEWVDRLTTLQNSSIEGIHLRLPGYENGPTLEIFEYKPLYDGVNRKGINREGFGHIAFLVDSVNEVLETVLRNGGTKLGEVIVNKVEGAGTLTAVYAADPEGNFIELQSWE